MKDEASRKPCEQCPWRLSNHRKRHPNGFYRKANLQRLWNQIRRGGGVQSCHLTDPSHPDHVAAGAKEGATARECPGSVILVLRELEHMKVLDKKSPGRGTSLYLKERKRGLTKVGIIYWLLGRVQLGGVPMFGGPKLPSVELGDQEIGLPEELRQ